MIEGGRVTSRELLFHHPFNMIVGGASGSGKTEWTYRFLRECKLLIDPVPQHVLYCYGVYNSRVRELTAMGVETHLGLPTERLIRDKPKPLLLVLDDLMMEAKSDFLDLLFTRGSHHWGVSIVFITQNMFEKSVKTARNNAHYLTLLRNPSGQLQIRNLGVQLFPRRLNYFMDAYQDATKDNFGYLLIDMHPSSAELLRLRTRIFADEAQILYTPKVA
jgi:hypothetical protein